MLKIAVLSFAVMAAFASLAEAYTTTRCTQTYGGGIRCTTSGSGTYITTVCTPTFGGGQRCTSY